MSILWEGSEFFTFCISIIGQSPKLASQQHHDLIICWVQEGGKRNANLAVLTVSTAQSMIDFVLTI